MKLRGKKAKNNIAQRKTAADTSGSGVHRILVPIDFSEHSKKALKYAISFAGKFNSELILVYVVEPTIYPADFSFGQVAVPSIENELRERGKAELDNLANALIAESSPVKKIVRTGKPYLEIIKTAVEEGVNIIIIATHGHSGVEHLLFGGTTEKVVRKAPCPVLIVRPVERSEE
jgi:nucleotide-binding universal stress UspA family protein